MKVIIASGKRKEAIATARLRPGKGNITINKQPVEISSTGIYNLRIKEPLILAKDVAQKVDIAVNVKGGGIASQADAIRLAIAKALVQHKKPLERVFLDYDRTLLVADVRRHEPSKPNCRGHRRQKRQKSYR